METILSPPAHSKKPKLQPLLHKDFGSCIPYYDEELGLMQGEAHKRAIIKYAPCFEWIEEKLDLRFLSDQPIWFYNPQKGKQVGIAGDLVLAKQVDVSKITAESILFYMEVVSTDDPRRENRDTIEKKPLCEYNGVPEFGLYFPDLKDERIFQLYRLVNGVYHPVMENESGKWCSEMIEGLCIERLTEDEWKEGVKIQIWFGDEKLLGYAQEVERRKQSEKEKEEAESKWGDAEIARWEAEKKVKALSDKLKALGINPED
ncbi:MAG: Uma2 family endonuclease [Leptospiraceae bacterium]|nr:Uma2 family endonuclease [Leptospiraceae bacterium]